MASPAQLGRIRRLIGQGGLDFERALDLAEEVTGTPITKLEDLDTSEASAFIERLEDGRF
jgi:hypothetical protein